MDPGFATSLHTNIGEKKQAFNSWFLQLKYKPMNLELQSAITKAQYDIEVMQDSLVRIQDGCYYSIWAATVKG